MKIGFEDIKKLLTDHTEHFGTLDKDMRSLKHEVNNSITVVGGVIQGTTDEFRATSIELQAFAKKSVEDINQVTEVYMNTNRALRPYVM
ncbi:hypothetical protein CJ030_MR1G019570 [Morella rubra]|uniref:Uncharacterized protein n=1 Tax=Morella rubra TaxID=262757 RepID=A0A6A1WNK7_9ROSI|nr:hypothetical protein CJ030_MR1G019570 [Morella rubra]